MESFNKDGFTPILSNHIDGAKYDSGSKVMTLRFVNGYVYSVRGVEPKHYEDFMKAPSQGDHFHREIKNNFHIERVK